MVKKKQYKKEGFVKENQTLIIIIVFLLALVWLFNQNSSLMPQSITNPFLANQEIIYTQDQQSLPPTSTSPSIVDLRTVFLPYFAVYPDAQYTCEVYGGTWSYQQNLVGCVGAGPATCSDPMAYAAMTQCVGVGGEWVCNTSNAYCSIS